MLTISNPLKGAGCGNYYFNHGRDDYYINGLDEPGRWYGTAVKPLELGKRIKHREFQNLLDGFSPDRRLALVQNAGSEDRQCGWDLTFSAPKSVSVLWAFSSPDVRAQIEQAHQSAVASALDYLEAVAGVARRGSGGAIREPAALLFATFQHGTSRDQDPQLHTHAVLINLGLRQDGTTGTLRSRNFFQEKMTGGMLYQVALAAALRTRLKLVLKPDYVGFHICDIPKALCRSLSKRRQEIEELMEERGVTNAIAAKAAALDTRKKKQNIPPAELFEKWRKEGEALGWTREQVQQSILVEREVPHISGQQFAKLFQAAATDLPPDKRTTKHLARLAGRMAIQLDADSRVLLQELPKLKLLDEPARQRKSTLAQPVGKTVAPSKWQLNFNAPQSVSALWALSPPEVRKKLEQLHKLAVAAATDYLERILTQRDRSGADRQPDAPRFTTSHYVTSPKRAPRLHTQAVINLGAPPDQSLDFPQEKKTAVSLYQAELAATLRTELKLMVEPAADGFQIRGVPPELCHKLRRNNPRKQAQPPRDDQKDAGAKTAGVDTPKQLPSVPSPELFEKWRKDAESLGWSAEKVRPNPHQQQEKESQRISGQQFEERFQEAAADIPPNQRTLQRLIRLAVKLAIQLGAGALALLAQLVKLNAIFAKRRAQAQASNGHNLAGKRLLRVEWQTLFPNAPFWSPAKNLKRPMIIIGQKPVRFRRWENILWWKPFLTGELRLQMRPLFPHAPAWSPARLIELPALRLAPKLPESAHVKRSENISRSH